MSCVDSPIRQHLGSVGLFGRWLSDAKMAAGAGEAVARMSVEGAFIVAIGCALGDPGAVTQLLDQPAFMSTIAEDAEQEHLTFAKLTWPSRGKKGGKGGQSATPTWLIVKGAHPGLTCTKQNKN